MENEFYVYVYLDPRKGGNFKYNEFEFKYEPFYVGKGKEYRYKRHLAESQLNDKSHKSNLIKKLIRLGDYPDILILKNHLSENEALELEKYLIRIIGRYDEKTGPLTNKTEGGDGISGYKWTEEQKGKIKGKIPPNKGLEMSNEQKIKIGLANRGKTWGHDKERVIEFSKFKSEQYSGDGNPFYGKQHTKETLKKISKRVAMYDFDMNLVDEYDSVTECANENGFPISKVSSVANGRIKHYKKYKFKFI